MATILDHIFELEKELVSINSNYLQLNKKIHSLEGMCKERDQIRNSKEILESNIKIQSKYINESVEALIDLKNYLDHVDQAHDAWIDHSQVLFKKAALMHVRIEFHPDGYGMVSYAKIPGLYTRSDCKGKYLIQLTGNGRQMADLKKLADISFPYWQKFFEQNKKFWNRAGEYVAQKKLLSFDDQQNCFFYFNSQIDWIRKKRADFQELQDTRNKYNLGKYANIDDMLKQMKHDLEVILQQNAAAKQKLAEQKELFAKTDPVLAGFTLPSEIKSHAYDKEWLKIVKKAASVRKNLTMIPLGKSGYFDWTASEQPNIFFPSGQNAIKDLEMLVSSLLLMFPVPSLHITVIGKDKVTQFFKELDEKVCQVLYDDQEINAYFSLLTKRFNEAPDADLHAVRSMPPKELVILLGYDSHVYGYTLSAVKNLLRRGCEGGIYFMAIPSEDYDESRDDFRQFFRTDVYVSQSVLQEVALVEVPDEEAAVGKKAVMKERKATMADLIINYVHQCAVTPNNTVYEEISSGKLYQDKPIKDLKTEQVYSMANQLVVPFASSTDGQPMQLHFATADHFSTFVIGKSGSGKSYLLHSLLTNMLLKYDSSCVDLILMDFKMGGVELNYYKDVPHVSKLLVNGSDKQIVCEIMISLEAEMAKRGEELNRRGVNNIDEYNDFARAHNLPLMRHIILLVDECQGLFKIGMNKRNSREEIQEIVENIARQGRNQGVHLVFATQVFHSSGIPQAAIKQFTDFLFMECTSADVADCDIDNTEVKKEVEKLRKGEVIHYSHGAYTMGYVYDYAGSDGMYKKKTREVLCNKARYTPYGEQFYFNASQLYYFGNRDLRRLDKRMDRSPSPVAALGCSLSVQNEPMMVRLPREEGGNLLILGYNRELQAERVLWHALMSLVYSHHKLNKPAQFNVFATFREDEDTDKYLESHVNCRYGMLRKLEAAESITVLRDNERNKALMEIGALIRRRMQGADKEQAVYLVMPNQEVFRKNLNKRMSDFEPVSKPQFTAPSNSDDLGFEMPQGFGSTAKPGAPVFQKIDQGQQFRQAAFEQPSARSASVDLNEELKFILANGPEQHVHVLMQVVSPDKVFAGDNGALRRSEMEKLFSNIVMLRMTGTAADSLPVQSNMVDKLEIEVQRMRALVWTEDGSATTFVPYDFPGGQEDHTKGAVLQEIIK